MSFDRIKKDSKRWKEQWFSVNICTGISYLTPVVSLTIVLQFGNSSQYSSTHYVSSVTGYHL